MAGPIYVIGHKHSDMDSVASAYADARLLQLQGEEQAIPTRHGNLKPEVHLVLKRFKVEAPEALEDVYLQVRDVMRRGVISARIDQPLLESGQLLQEHNRRSMTVVDAENKVQGIIAVEDFAQLFFKDLDPQTVNRIPLQQDNLVRVLKGRVLVEGRRKLGNRVIVGAMQAETMADYVEPGCLVLLGDREDAQIMAMERGAAALVVTGDLLVSERTLASARKHGVMVISTAHHTFTAVRLINLSMRTQDIMYREFDFCHPEEQMSEVQRKLARRHPLPVVDGEGKLIGFLSRTDLLNARPKRVVLVDHNEHSQAVDGIDEAELLGIIDHHRIADVHTNKPIMFRADPAFSHLHGTRRACRSRTGEIAGEQIEQFGQELFAAATADLGERSVENLLTTDFKEFMVNDTRFAVGTVEAASPATIEKRMPELLATMQRLAKEDGYTIAAEERYGSTPDRISRFRKRNAG